MYLIKFKLLVNFIILFIYQLAQDYVPKSDISKMSSCIY